MRDQPASPPFWRIIALTGIALLSLGIGAMYVDSGVHSGVELIENHYAELGWGGIIGFVLAIVGLIGWVKQLEKQKGFLMAALVFLSPFVMLLLGSLFEPINAHGAAAPVILLIFPASILALVLAIMAGTRQSA